jgi:hypothetical protein
MRKIRGVDILLNRWVLVRRVWRSSVGVWRCSEGSIAAQLRLKHWALPVSPCNLFRVDGIRRGVMGSLHPP